VHLREILLLSYFQRLSYNQIADSLEIPLGTVKSRLHSAVAAFARAWNAERGHDEYSEERTDENAT
jgi:RNA polymerase sigma-70 factor (ECF subfamily)